MDLVYIIIASQEYDRANHQFLWKEIAKQSQAEVFVINIPADYLVSLIKRKSFRIKESKAGSVKVNDNLRVLRPLFWVRPDILPEFFYGRVCKAFWKQIKAEVSANKAFYLLDTFACSEIKTHKDGSLTVIFSAPQESWLIGMLLSFGPDIKILSPVEIKDELIKLARLTTDLYSN